jgi:hypothetical protein
MELMATLENERSLDFNEVSEVKKSCPYPGCNGQESNDLSASSHYRY